MDLKNCLNLKLNPSLFRPSFSFGPRPFFFFPFFFSPSAAGPAAAVRPVHSAGPAAPQSSLSVSDERAPPVSSSFYLPSSRRNRRSAGSRSPAPVPRGTQPESRLEPLNLIPCNCASSFPSRVDRGRLPFMAQWRPSPTRFAPVTPGITSFLAPAHKPFLSLRVTLRIPNPSSPQAAHRTLHRNRAVAIATGPSSSSASFTSYSSLSPSIDRKHGEHHSQPTLFKYCVD